MNAIEIIAAFGGPSRMAAALGRRTDEIHDWLDAGEIPGEDRWDVLLVAARRQLAVTVADLFPEGVLLPADIYDRCAQARLTREDTARLLGLPLHDVRARTADMPFRRRRSPRERLGDERRAEILKLHEQGLTATEIAGRIRMTPTNVRLHLRKLGQERNVIREATRKHIEKVRDLARRRFTASQIAEELGLNRGYVSRLKQLGGIETVDARKGRRPKNPSATPPKEAENV